MREYNLDIVWALLVLDTEYSDLIRYNILQQLETRALSEDLRSSRLSGWSHSSEASDRLHHQFPSSLYWV